MRTCDGKDPWLLKPSDDSSGYSPCDCGNTFDDVEREVISPHRAIPPKLTEEQLNALYVGIFGREPPGV